MMGFTYMLEIAIVLRTWSPSSEDHALLLLIHTMTAIVMYQDHQR